MVEDPLRLRLFAALRQDKGERDRRNPGVAIDSEASASDAPVN